MSELYTPKPIPLLDNEFDEEGSLPTLVENGLQLDEEEDESKIPTEPLRAHIATLEAQKHLRWMQNIKPGAWRIYHVGNLMADRETDKHADLFGRLFMRAADHDLVLLVQQRFSPDKEDGTEYLAYRTSKDITPFHLRDLQTIISEFKG